MKLSWHFYLFAIAVAVVSVLLMYFAPTTDVFKGIFGTPSIAALFACLYQLSRDQAAHNHQIELQERAQLFDLSTASHMANIAFDKHVRFSEEYLDKLNNEVLAALIRHGPTQDALKQAGKLYEVRSKYPVWLTEEMQNRLMAFEYKISNIGITDMALKGMPPGGKRSDLVDKMYMTFREITGIGISEGVPQDEEAKRLAASAVVQYVRGILGVDELSKMRSAILKRAMNSLERR